MSVPTRQSGLPRSSVSWVVAFASALATLGPAAGPVPAATESAVELFVSVPSADGVDATGFRVLEDGQEVSGVEVEPLTGDWRVVVVFDQLLSSPLVVKSAALELGALAPELVAAGTVEVVLAGEEVTLSLPATTDGAQLEQALSWISVRAGGLGGQLAVRDRFLVSPAMADLAAGEYSAVSATAGRRIAEIGETVRRSIGEEVELLERQRQGLLTWLAEESDPRPRLLILVSEGWDEDPGVFYEKVLRRVKMGDLAETLTAPRPSPGVETLARTLSATGWRTLTFTPSRLAETEEVDGEAGLEGRIEGDDRVETVIQDGREIDRTTLKGIDPRDLWRRLGGRPLAAELTSAAAPLVALAEASGGARVQDRRRLSRFVDDLRTAVRVSYPTPASAPREDWRRVEVRRAGGGEVASRRWVTTYPPPVLAEARARRLLREDVEEGALTIAASHLVSEGVLHVETASPDDGEVPAGPLRATIAVARDGEPIQFRHQWVAAEDLFPAGEETEAVGFRLPATDLGLDALTVVLVEDLGRGSWGSGFVRGGTEGEAVAGGSFVLPAPKAVHLLMPTEPMLLGPTSFDTVASEAVSRIDFYLDGSLATSRAEPPFAARLDLGRLPRPRRVEAVAFDATGAVIGRDSLTINEGTGNFRVRIVRPTPDERRGSSELRVGAVEVEADLRLPGGVGLERLEFYWKDDLVGTRYAPPYVQRVNVPAGDPAGFVRVVGYLEDGSSAEDVAFVNSPAGSENLRVELIELYTVVTDRQGRPIRGLAEDDFRVMDDGVEQEIATFSDAGERPLTVGLAIDSSASMFVKLPEVQLAASSFLTGLTSPRDRAFVVGFGDEPFLQRDTTSDLGAVRTALSSLEPAGRTSIWKGIAYSLVQLQGVPGKKALIVFSDGADEDPDFSFRVALDFARRVGVPVYVVVSNNEIYRTGGKGLTIRGFMNRLESLARSVGGRVFVTRVGEDLEAIYREIDEELRSQYLLGYYVRDREDEDWRPITVEVDRPGARARTVTGYYQ